MTDYFFAGKSVFFPKRGILALGDLQIGYESMLKKKGINFPLDQARETINDIKIIINDIKKKGYKINKIIVAGDIKHHFGFDIEEKFQVRRIIEFLEKESEVILIRGNHEKFELDGRKYHDSFLEEGILFIHGERILPEINGKRVERVVMGHIHPAVSLSDKNGVKKEKYKCFLVGKWKGKEIFILPSFFPLIEGTALNERDSKKRDDFGIVPLRSLKNFDVFVVGDDEVLPFGKLQSL